MMNDIFLWMSRLRLAGRTETRTFWYGWVIECGIESVEIIFFLSTDNRMLRIEPVLYGSGVVVSWPQIIVLQGDILFPFSTGVAMWDSPLLFAVQTFLIYYCVFRIGIRRYWHSMSQKPGWWCWNPLTEMIGATQLTIGWEPHGDQLFERKYRRVISPWWREVIRRQRRKTGEVERRVRQNALTFTHYVEFTH